MQRKTNIKYLRVVKSTGRNGTKRVRRKSLRAVNRGEKTDSCAKAQWRKTLWRPHLLVRPSRGQGEFKRNSQIWLSYRWAFVSCGNIGTNANWPCYFVDACTYPCWWWCLHVGVILPQCLGEKDLTASNMRDLNIPWVYWVPHSHTRCRFVRQRMQI